MASQSELTDSEDSVFGTPISSSSSDIAPGLAGHKAKEQKFIVLTSSICRTRGFGLSESDTTAWSSGRAVLRAASSSTASFHTINLLSLPCLGTRMHWSASLFGAFRGE